jgi:hypothetical protein
VRTETIYLGPVGGRTRRRGVLRRIGEFIKLNLKRDGPSIDEEAVLREVGKRDTERERAKRDFYNRTGLRVGDPNPTPIDKPVPEISLAQQEAPSEVADGAKDQ